MRKRIEFRNEARHNLRAIERTTALRILQTLDRYSLTGEGDVIILTDVTPLERRQRVGDYRVRFYEDIESIVVLTVRNRREAYR